MDCNDSEEILDASKSPKMIPRNESEDNDGVETSDTTATSIEVGEKEVAKEDAIPTLESLHQHLDQFLSSLTLQTTNPRQEFEQRDESSNQLEECKEVEGKVVGVDIPAFIEKFLDLFVEEVKRRDVEDGRPKWDLLSENNVSFLGSLDRVSQLASSLEPLRSDSILGGLVNLVGSIQQRAMSYLEDELRLLLEEPLLDHGLHSQQNKQNSENSTELEDEELFSYREEAINSMSSLTKAMISCGYETECCLVYSLVRRHVLAIMLSNSGFDQVSIDETQKLAWEVLEREIPQWNVAYRNFASKMFFKEKKLAFSVFQSHPLIASSMVANLASGVTIHLLNFAEAVAMTKRSAEKLFKELDMYETLRDHVEAFEELFPEEGWGRDLKKEIFHTRCRLGEAAICMFYDLENSIQGDMGRTPVPGGAVHPLTRYTMNYLNYLCDYKEAIKQVFKEHPKLESEDPSRPNVNEDDSARTERHVSRENQHVVSSPFALQVISIIDLLGANMEAKSKLYRDVSLSSIFMMNNGRYILQKVKESKEIHDAVGDTWCRRKSYDIRNYHNNYKQETWRKLLKLLAHEGLQVNNKVIKPVLKDRLKGFTALFEEIHRTQVSWVIHDEQLRSELRVSISAVVIPAYRSFLGRFSQHLTPGRQYEKYIKYQPDDIETAIDELFDGKVALSIARKKP